MHKTQIEIRGVFWAVALVFSVFLVLPMALLLGKSFLVGGESGLGNYTAMLASPAFLESFRNSFLISGVSAALTTALAFFLAYAVNRQGRAADAAAGVPDAGHLRVPGNAAGLHHLHAADRLPAD